MSKNNYHQSQIEVMKIAAEQAGSRIMDICNSSSINITYKQDGSPVTNADIEANNIIIDILQNKYPDIPIVSEETIGSHNIDLSGKYFIIDPLDGTKEFIRSLEEFTVNIAFIDGGIPIMGVIYAPATGELFWVDEREKSFITLKNQTVKISNCNHINANEEVIALVSNTRLNRSMKTHLKQLGITKYSPMGSSLKLCKVAQGKAHIYTRITDTYEWDIAAGYAILLGAGGKFVTLDNKPYIFGRKLCVNEGFIASWE